jgi:hypothetical protein
MDIGEVLGGKGPRVFAKRCMEEGSELTNPRLSPLVVKYLDELKIEKMLKYGVTYESHISELARIKDLALNKNSFSAAVNAETNRGKAGGLYIDRKIIKHGKLEDMTEEQLEMKMAQIEEDYAGLLNDDAEVVEAIEISEPSLSSSHKKSEKQNAQKK